MSNSTKFDNKLNVIGSKIKYYREKCNLSQEGLSAQMQLLGVYISKNSLQRLEKGERVLKDFELAALSKIFKVSADTLLEDFIKKL